MNLLATAKHCHLDQIIVFPLTLQVLFSKVTAPALTGEKVGPKNRDNVSTINAMSYWRRIALIST